MAAMVQEVIAAEGSNWISKSSTPVRSNITEGSNIGAALKGMIKLNMKQRIIDAQKGQAAALKKEIKLQIDMGKIKKNWLQSLMNRLSTQGLNLFMSERLRAEENIK